MITDEQEKILDNYNEYKRGILDLKKRFDDIIEHNIIKTINAHTVAFIGEYKPHDIDFPSNTSSKVDNKIILCQNWKYGRFEVSNGILEPKGKQIVEPDELEIQVSKLFLQNTKLGNHGQYSRDVLQSFLLAHEINLFDNEDEIKSELFIFD